MSTISVVVPCAHFHAHLLGRVIDYYDQGTRKPDELVIAISGSKLTPAAKKQFGEGRSYPVIVTDFKRPLTAGENRQRGSDVSSGEIIVYQDADDFAHPQRLEALERVYSTHDTLHVSHFWIASRKALPWALHDLNDLRVEPVSFADDSIFNEPYGARFGQVTAGATSIRRTVLSSIHWGHGDGRWEEDWHFNMWCLQIFNKSHILCADLYAYTKG
jgi:glycosyltransferase involved in cell wall biosynthesis